MKKEGVKAEMRLWHWGEKGKGSQGQLFRLALFGVTIGSFVRLDNLASVVGSPLLSAERISPSLSLWTSETNEKVVEDRKGR